MEKYFDCGVIIPHKFIYCSGCKNIPTCNRRNKLVNQSTEFSAYPNELKPQPPYSKGHLLPWFIDNTKKQILICRCFIKEKKLEMC